MTTVNANEVALGIEFFGDDDAPLVLLAGGTTMLSWPDALCDRLADGGRRVVRYDLRGHGMSQRPPTGYTSAVMADDFLDAISHADMPSRAAHASSVGCQ